MYKFGQLFKKKKGSLTVEAAISLPIFMCVFLSILFFIRVIYIQNNVQYALNGAANELSTYSYLYSVSGLQKVNNEIVEITTENSELASDHTVKLLESFDALSENFQEGLESTKQLSEGDLSQIESLKGIYDKSLPPAENVKNVLGDAISDPKREFVSIASLFLNSGYEELKRNLAEPLVKFYMKKYIDPKIISSKGGPGAYISVKEGQDPFKLFDFGKEPVFDFSKSKIFTDNKTIDLVVRYKIKTALPINFLPEIQMEQRATVRAWLDGDGSARVKKPEPTVEEGTSVWDLAQFDYGKIISEKELSKYPDRHPKSGDAYEVRSINLDSKSYINNPKTIKSSLKTTINKFHSKTAGKSDITSRTLIVVVPEGTMSDDIRKIFEELENECSALSPPIKLIYKEGYGRQTNRQEEASDKSVEDSDEEGPSPTVKKSDLVILLPNTPAQATPTPTVAATPTQTEAPKESINGIEIIDGKVAGKIPVDEYKELRNLSIHNLTSDTLTLGRYRPTIDADGTEIWDIPGPDSYNTIAKKDGHMYFDMGSAYEETMKKYNLSSKDMFKLFNAPALDDAVMSGKKIRFIHDPEAEENKDRSIYQEYIYLNDKYKFNIVKEGEFWYAKK